MTVNKKGLSRLDFDETKEIAEQVGFDITVCSKKLHSCGPGPKYYENDKRYFVLMLLKHIEQIQQNNTTRLSSEVRSWYNLATEAIKEYGEFEHRTWGSWKKD